MIQWKKIGISGGIIFFVLASNLCAETLVGGIGNWRPWTWEDGNEAVGILVDVFKIAVKHAGHEAEIKALPHKRRNDIEWGSSVHVELGVLPEWREKYKEVSVYTIPFVKTQDIILAKKGAMEKAVSVEDFYGKRLGATLGYFYVDGFSEAFEAGKIVRDDSSEGPSLMRKLDKGRIDGAILDKHEARYWIKMLNLNPEDFEIIYTFSIVSNLRMRLHKSKEHVLPELNAALQSMLDDGTIQEIIENY